MGARGGHAGLLALTRLLWEEEQWRSDRVARMAPTAQHGQQIPELLSLAAGPTPPSHPLPHPQCPFLQHSPAAVWAHGASQCPQEHHCCWDALNLGQK